MSEIDTMDRPVLLKRAAELGLTIASSTRTDIIRAKIKQTLGEPLAEDKIDEEVKADLMPAMNKKEAVDPAMKPVTLTIEESDATNSPVVVTLNGRNYVMQRGMEVTVPQAVVEILDHATIGKVDRKTGEVREIRRFPYHVSR